MFDSSEHEDLVRFATSLVGPDWAEDVVQDYYVKVLSGEVARFREEALHWNWVLQIVKYTALRCREREGRHAAVWRETDSSEAPQYDFMLDALRQFNRLCKHHQDVLLLANDNHTYDAMASTLGLTSHQVRGRLHRARRRIREAFA